LAYIYAAAPARSLSNLDDIDGLALDHGARPH
jgi:hypothetical protein